MRRSTLIRVIMAAIILGAIARPMGAGAPPDTVIAGLLVDSACYMSMGILKSLDPDHMKCAILCAQKSQRLAIVTPRGDVYMIVGDYAASANAKLISLLNIPVIATGTVAVRPLALAPPPPTDDRRTINNQGLTFLKTFKKGDDKEGDIQDSSETTIDITSIKPVITLP